MPISEAKRAERDRQMSGIDAAMARPKAIDDIPVKIRDRAIQMFEDNSLSCTGHKWDWQKASEEIQLKWVVRAFTEAWRRAFPTLS